MSASTVNNLSRLLVTLPMAGFGIGLGLSTALQGNDATGVSGPSAQNSVTSRLSGASLAMVSFYSAFREVDRTGFFQFLAKQVKAIKLIPKWVFQASPLTNIERITWTSVGAAASAALAYASDPIMRYAVPFVKYAWPLVTTAVPYGFYSLLNRVYTVSETTMNTHANLYNGLNPYASDPSEAHLGIAKISTIAIGMLLAQMISRRIPALLPAEPPRVFDGSLEIAIPDLNCNYEFGLSNSEVKIFDCLNILHNDFCCQIEMICADKKIRRFENVTVAVVAQQFWNATKSSEKKILMSNIIDSFVGVGTQEAYRIVEEKIRSGVPTTDWLTAYIEFKSKEDYKVYGLRVADFWLFQALLAKFKQCPNALLALQLTGKARLDHDTWRKEDLSFNNIGKLLYFIRDQKAEKRPQISLSGAAATLNAARRFHRNANVPWGEFDTYAPSASLLQPPEFTRQKPVTVTLSKPVTASSSVSAAPSSSAVISHSATSSSSSASSSSSSVWGNIVSSVRSKLPAFNGGSTPQSSSSSSSASSPSSSWSSSSTTMSPVTASSNSATSSSSSTSTSSGTRSIVMVARRGRLNSSSPAITNGSASSSSSLSIASSTSGSSFSTITASIEPSTPRRQDSSGSNGQSSSTSSQIVSSSESGNGSSFGSDSTFNLPPFNFNGSNRETLSWSTDSFPQLSAASFSFTGVDSGNSQNSTNTTSVPS